MDKDAGTIAALMLRFKDYRLPRALRMRDRVRAGEVLSDEDIAWLERIFAESNSVRSLVERNPEYESLVVSAINLYAEIIELGVGNEKAAGRRPDS
jgi:hypothetical protein